MIRKASHGGSWYTGDSEKLGEELDGWIKASGLVGSPDVRGVIAPHAGYSYSGRAVAYAFANIDPTSITRVFLLGPSRHYYTPKCALSRAIVYKTPVGDLPIDLEGHGCEFVQGRRESWMDNIDSGPILGKDQTTLSQGQAHWLPYKLPSILRHPQQQQQNMMSVYMPGHQVAHQSLPMADVAYPETTMAISPAASLMGQPSDTMTAARKRSAPGGVHERTVERRHKRMIKNRESAAHSRARKQAYTNELENKASRLEEENERRRRKKTGGGTLPITARTLETMIRLSTAHAKLMQRRELDQQKQEQQQRQRLCVRVQRQQLRLAGLLKN